MYIFPQPTPRRRVRPTPGLGSVRITRVPTAAIFAARGSGVHTGPGGSAPGFLFSRPSASAGAVAATAGQSPKPGIAKGGVPFSLNPHRQPSGFTEIGPGSGGAPSAGGFARSVRRQNALARRRTMMLGAITPDQAAEQIFPAAKVRSGAGHNQAVRDLMVQAAQTGQIFSASGQPGYIPGTRDCAGVTGSKAPVVLKAIGGTAIKFAASTGPGAPFVLAAGVVLEAAAFITGIFTHHHQQAVAKERGTLCVEVPAAQNALMAIDAAVQAGQMTPAQAQDALDSLVSNFRSSVSGIIHGSDPTSSGECNAACVMLSELRAIVAAKKSQYQDLAANPAAASLGLPLNMPSWALPAAAAAALWFLF